MGGGGEGRDRKRGVDRGRKRDRKRGIDRGGRETGREV